MALLPWVCPREKWICRKRSWGGEEGDWSMFSANVFAAEMRPPAEKWTSRRPPRDLP